jgi:hypothetical protein
VPVARNPPFLFLINPPYRQGRWGGSGTWGSPMHRSATAHSCQSCPSYVAAPVAGTVNARSLPASHLDTAPDFLRNLNTRGVPWGKYRKGHRPGAFAAEAVSGLQSHRLPWIPEPELREISTDVKGFAKRGLRPDPKHHGGRERNVQNSRWCP